MNGTLIRRVMDGVRLTPSLSRAPSTDFALSELGSVALTRRIPPSGPLLVQPGWLSVGRLVGGLFALAIGIAFGLLIVGQWQSRTTSDPSSSRHRFTQQTIVRLEAEQAQLKKQIVSLRAAAAADQQRLGRGQTAIATVSRALDEQRAIAGTVPLQGAGIEILLDDSRQRPNLPTDDPNNYIVHEYQIRDVVNALWQAGAVGISVNGERFVNSTSVYCVGSTILINDTRTSPPYRIRAVGDPGRLRQALEDGNVLGDLKGRARSYGLVFRVARSGTFTLPAFAGSINLKHTTVSGAVR